LVSEILRKFYVGISDCPSHLYAVVALPWEIQKVISFNIIHTLSAGINAFSALTLLVGQQN